MEVNELKAQSKRSNHHLAKLKDNIKEKLSAVQYDALKTDINFIPGKRTIFFYFRVRGRDTAQCPIGDDSIMNYKIYQDFSLIINRMIEVQVYRRNPDKSCDSYMNRHRLIIGHCTVSRPLTLHF